MVVNFNAISNPADKQPLFSHGLLSAHRLISPFPPARAEPIGANHMFDQHVYVLSTDATLPTALAAAGVDHTVFPDSRTLTAALPVHARGLVIVDLQLPGPYF